MKKLLLAIQYWDGDRSDAIELMELLANDPRGTSPWADIVVFARFDSELPNEGTLFRLRKAFKKVFAIKGAPQLIGYPDGCNGLWANLVETAYKMSTESSTNRPPPWSEYSGVLAIESDCCPLDPSWLESIHREWSSSPAVIMGCWLSSGEHSVGHINGNAVFAMDLFKRAAVPMIPPHGKSWDTWHAKLFHALGWKKSKTITSLWNHSTSAPAQLDILKKYGCVLLHGVKDDSVRRYYSQILSHENPKQ